MFLGLGLIIAAGILLWPTGNRGQAAGSLHVVPADRVMLPDSPQPGVARTFGTKRTRGGVPWE
jgi:hypothetical protein